MSPIHFLNGSNASSYSVHSKLINFQNTTHTVIISDHHIPFPFCSTEPYIYAQQYTPSAYAQKGLSFVQVQPFVRTASLASQRRQRLSQMSTKQIHFVFAFIAQKAIQKEHNSQIKQQPKSKRAPNLSNIDQKTPIFWHLELVNAVLVVQM